MKHPDLSYSRALLYEVYIWVINFPVTVAVGTEFPGPLGVVSASIHNTVIEHNKYVN